MNWGYKILVVMLLFIAGMGTMVSIAMKQRNEMIDEHYYVKELLHQGQIDAENNLNSLNEQLSITDEGGALKLHIPSASNGSVTEGSITFLRSSDQSKDRRFLLKPNSLGVQMISKSNFVKGQYKVRISWKNDAKPYYFEQSVFVN
ncbi:MAG: FixH family protein [Bacteroidota bacterium]